MYSTEMRAANRLTKAQVAALNALSAYDDDERPTNLPGHNRTYASLENRGLVRANEFGPHLTPAGHDLLACYI